MTSQALQDAVATLARLYCAVPGSTKLGCKSVQKYLNSQPYQFLVRDRGPGKPQAGTSGMHLGEASVSFVPPPSSLRAISLISSFVCRYSQAGKTMVSACPGNCESALNNDLGFQDKHRRWLARGDVTATEAGRS